jgi:hypothetical protein
MREPIVLHANLSFICIILMRPIAFSLEYGYAFLVSLGRK